MEPQHLKILIVEDEAAHAEAISRAFTAAGRSAEIWVAGKLSEYRQFVAELTPDIALMDLNLPDGRATEVLTCPPEHGNFPILIMTAYGNEQMAVEAIKAGALDYVVKSPEAFIAMPRAVDRALREWNLLQEHRRADEALRKSEDKYRHLVENLGKEYLFYRHDTAGVFTYVSPSVKDMLGYSQQEALSHYTGFVSDNPLNKGVVKHTALSIQGLQQPSYEVEIVHKDGSLRWLEVTEYPVRNTDGHVVAVEGIAKDITEHKIAEKSRLASLHFLETLHKYTEIKPLLEELAHEIKDYTGCDSVAIRVLDEGGNIPYQACDGFSRKFVEMESPLSIHSDRCMCINVIKGTTNPRLPFYTKGGSFYMNGTTRFLAAVSEEEKGQTRNVCNREGYESVALVPYKSGGRVLGLIHVADHRENMVPLRIVEHLEGVAMQLGTAFQRARAEDALRKSEAQYRSLFEHMVEGYAHCRMFYEGERPTDFMYLDVNNAFETLTGLKNVAGKRVSDVLPGLRDSDPGLFEIYGRVALTGKPERFEVFVEALSDWFSISVYSPQKEHFVAVFDVITERWKAEESLRESEARFSKVFHSSPVGIVISLLPEGTLVDVNETFLKVYGYEREEIIGRSSFDLQLWVNPEDRTRMIETLRNQGRVQNIEAKFRRQSGEICVLLISAELIEVAGKQCLLGMFSDITERKRMEEALRASEVKYRDLVDNAPIGIYKASLDGRFLYVNKALSTLFEFASPEEMMSESVLQRYKNPQDRALVIDSLKKTGKVHNFEIQTLSKSGKQIYLLLNSTLEGDVVSGMVLDVTEQKKLEAQLRHSQKMEAIGTLAGGIAHDFNNILNAVLGFGTLALDKIEKGHPSRDDLREVLAAAERAANLTQRLLAFSRKQIADLKPVDVNEIVMSIEKMLSRIIGEDIKLITDLTDQKTVVMADAGQIEQVLMNLAANARDAMPKGGRLTIHTGVREIDNEFITAYGYGNPGRYAIISVTDTGTGIDKETQKKIFEPFFTTKGVGEGTGLGLSTAYGIVKRHRGFINVYSEAGEGTTFRILLPLSEELAIRKQHVSVFDTPKGGKESILIAEDDASLRKLSRIVLESFGYDVITAEDGDAAIAKFIENRDKILLVILDMIMPRKNGREAYEEIKKIRPDIKIIFASGYTKDNIQRKELLDKGMDFILKPVAPKDLLNKVREVLDR